MRIVFFQPQWKFITNFCPKLENQKTPKGQRLRSGLGIFLFLFFFGQIQKKIRLRLETRSQNYAYRMWILRKTDLDSEYGKSL